MENVEQTLYLPESIKILRSKKPVYFAAVNGETLELSENDLLDFKHYSKTCFRLLHRIPDPMKQPAWIQHVNRVMSSAEIVEPHEGFYDALEDFCMTHDGCNRSIPMTWTIG